MYNLPVNLENKKMTTYTSVDSVDTTKWQDSQRIYNCVWQMTWFVGWGN